MSPEVFSICIWSLLYATIFAPFVFRMVLKNHVRREAERAGARGDQADFSWDAALRASMHMPAREIDMDYKNDRIVVNVNQVKGEMDDHSHGMKPQVYGDVADHHNESPAAGSHHKNAA